MSSKTLLILAALLGGGLVIYHFREDLKWPFPAGGEEPTGDSPSGTDTTPGNAPNPSKPPITAADIVYLPDYQTDAFDWIKSVIDTTYHQNN